MEIEHPLRLSLVDELHARPSPRLSAPGLLSYVAFKEPVDAANRDRRRDLAHLAALTRRMGGAEPVLAAAASAPPLGDEQTGTRARDGATGGGVDGGPVPVGGHYAAQIGPYDLRWESHAEFVTYAVFAAGLSQRPFAPDQPEVLAEAWQRAAPGGRIAAIRLRLAVLPDDPAAILPELARDFAQDGLSVSWVLDEQGVVATDFRVDAEGWMRMAVYLRPEIGPGRTGRLVQRLCELETYRAMAMLGLGRARGLSAELNLLDPRLVALVQGMVHDQRPAAQVLDELLQISALLESAATATSFRFGATEAYDAIVQSRIDTLRESRFMGRQMLNEFMVRRYSPAMRTVRSAQRRLAAMVDRSARAGELLRTRVDVERSAQNQALLARMDRRAGLQLRLQHTVEGLSVVAISYYAVGLLAYLLTPAAHAAGVEKSLLLAAMVPVVVGLVWLAMRRIKSALHRAADEGHGDDL